MHYVSRQVRFGKVLLREQSCLKKLKWAQYKIKYMVYPFCKKKCEYGGIPRLSNCNPCTVLSCYSPPPRKAIALLMSKCVSIQKTQSRPFPTGKQHITLYLIGLPNFFFMPCLPPYPNPNPISCCINLQVSPSTTNSSQS